MTCSRQIPSPQQALVIWRTGRGPAHWRAEREIRCAPAHRALDVADLALRVSHRCGGLFDAVRRLASELARRVHERLASPVKL
jgi:hypothetical protein